jgi:hypothetical protein
MGLTDSKGEAFGGWRAAPQGLNCPLSTFHCPLRNDLQARFYKAGIGRFFQEDTVYGNAGDPLSLNLYTCCSNNPIKYWDPSGHKKVTIKLKDGTTTTGYLEDGKLYMPDDNGKRGGEAGSGTQVYDNGSLYKYSPKDGVKLIDSHSPSPSQDTGSGSSSSSGSSNNKDTNNVGGNNTSPSSTSGNTNSDEDIIKEAQKLLEEMGFDIGSIDGISGINTNSAVILVQYFMTSSVTGVIDEKFVEVLRNLKEDGTNKDQIMWYFNNQWKPEKAEINGANGRLDVNDFAQVTATGGIAYLEKNTAVAWAFMVQSAIDYNNNLREGATKLDINQFKLQGSASGYRSFESQQYYWDLWQAGKGNRAAYPGTSNHGFGVAMDLMLETNRQDVTVYKDGTMKDIYGNVITKNGEKVLACDELLWLMKNYEKFGLKPQGAKVNKDENGKMESVFFGETWHYDYTNK